jgi:hypothetical protein
MWIANRKCQWSVVESVRVIRAGRPGHRALPARRVVDARVGEEGADDAGFVGGRQDDGEDHNLMSGVLST